MAASSIAGEHGPAGIPRPNRRGVLAGAFGLLCGARPAFAAAPERIASFDYGLTETLLVLGRPPVAVPDTAGWARWVVEPPLPPDVRNLGSDQEPNLELLAALAPELILTTPFLDALTPTLSRIAPCERLAIFEEGGAGPLERAEGVLQRLGTELDRPDQAADYRAATDRQFAAARARLASRHLPPLLVVDFIDPRHVRAYGAKSLWQDVLDRLGLANAWTAPTTYWGFSTVGIEALATAPPDALLVCFDPIPADVLPTLRDSPLWRALPFGRPGRLIRLPQAFVFGAVPSARRFARLLVEALAPAAAP